MYIIIRPVIPLPVIGMTNNSICFKNYKLICKPSDNTILFLFLLYLETIIVCTIAISPD